MALPLLPDDDPAEHRVTRSKREGGWSVEQYGKRLGFYPRVVLTNVRFVVNPEGRAWYLERQGQLENLHAYAGGVLHPDQDQELPAAARQVRYHPTEGEHFYLVDTGEPLTSAALVCFEPDGQVWAQV